MSLQQNAAWLRAACEKIAAQGFKRAYDPGWETRTNGGASPDHEAIIVHHTGADTTPTAYLRDGERARPMIPPYAQIHVRRDATLVVIAAGGASHAGMVDRSVWDRIVGGTAPLDRDMKPGPDSKTFSANRPGIGVEVNGSGGPGDWTAEQYATVVAFCAAYHEVRGWRAPSPRVGAHKELTTRKPGDPYAPMGALRTAIKNHNTTEDDMYTDDDRRRDQQMAARVMGFLTQRYDASGNPARALDNLDGDYLRVLTEETSAKLGVDIAAVRAQVDAQAGAVSDAITALQAVAATLDDVGRAKLDEIASRLQATVSITTKSA